MLTNKKLQTQIIASFTQIKNKSSRKVADVKMSIGTAFHQWEALNLKNLLANDSLHLGG